MLSESEPIEPVVAFARRFLGVKPMAVCSGGERHIVKNTLTLLGIVDHFDAIIGLEDYARGKPTPDPCLAVTRSLGVAPERGPRTLSLL